MERTPRKTSSPTGSFDDEQPSPVQAQAKTACPVPGVWNSSRQPAEHISLRLLWRTLGLCVYQGPRVATTGHRPRMSETLIKERNKMTAETEDDTSLIDEQQKQIIGMQLKLRDGLEYGILSLIQLHEKSTGLVVRKVSLVRGFSMEKMEHTAHVTIECQLPRSQRQ